MKYLLIILLFSCSSTQVSKKTVRWDMPSKIDNVTYFKVYCRDKIFRVDMPRTYIKFQLKSGRNCFQVTAFNEVGESEKSEIRCISGE